MKNYYKVLGLKITSTQEQIKKAYRELVKKLHPDVCDDTEESNNKLHEVNEAYSILSDSDKKDEYDNELAEIIKKRRQKKSEKIESEESIEYYTVYEQDFSGTPFGGGCSFSYANYGPSVVSTPPFMTNEFGQNVGHFACNMQNQPPQYQTQVIHPNTNFANPEINNYAYSQNPQASSYGNTIINPKANPNPYMQNMQNVQQPQPQQQPQNYANTFAPNPNQTINPNKNPNGFSQTNPNTRGARQPNPQTTDNTNQTPFAAFANSDNNQMQKRKIITGEKDMDSRLRKAFERGYKSAEEHASKVWAKKEQDLLKRIEDLGDKLAIINSKNTDVMTQYSAEITKLNAKILEMQSNQSNQSNSAGNDLLLQKNAELEQELLRTRMVLADSQNSSKAKDMQIEKLIQEQSRYNQKAQQESEQKLSKQEILNQIQTITTDRENYLQAMKKKLSGTHYATLDSFFWDDKVTLEKNYKTIKINLERDSSNLGNEWLFASLDIAYNTLKDTYLKEEYDISIGVGKADITINRNREVDFKNKINKLNRDLEQV